jgi:hypothetical protein
MATAICVPLTARTQPPPPDVVASLRDVVGSRIEAAVILTGEEGISGGTFSQASGGTIRRGVQAKVTKVGGVGDAGHRRPLGSLPVRWQLRFQGSLGYLTANNQFQAGLLEGDESLDRSFALQFGGGVRLWFNDHLSFAPTVMGLYGHIQNTYTARSEFATTNLLEFQQLGLVDWTANTWSIIPAVDVKYLFTWHRTVFTLQSDFAYYHTQSFAVSNPSLTAGGDSETWRNKVDLDIPLGITLFDQELHGGGFFSRIEFYGDLRDGLDTEHMYQIHGRLVLDLVDRLWKFKWIGAGGSYLWGSNFHAWTLGADVSIKF